jgi:hypothetical protein
MVQSFLSLTSLRGKGLRYCNCLRAQSRKGLRRPNLRPDMRPPTSDRGGPSARPRTVHSGSAEAPEDVGASQLAASFKRSMRPRDEDEPMPRKEREIRYYGANATRHLTALP